MVLIPVAGGEAKVVYGHTPDLAVVPLASEDMFGVATITIYPTQIVGLIPLSPCDEVECRTFREICDKANVVFGNSGVSTATYENDFSTFLLDYSLYSANPNLIQVTMKLQRFFQGEWRDYPFGVNLNTNQFGTYYPFGSIPGHYTYTGYAINWGLVLFSAGQGCFRFVADSSFLSPFGQPIVGCLMSPPFILKAWNCNLAKGTVKFENWLTGSVGEKRKDYVIYDLCGVSWYDSIRIKGWFGYYKVPEYKEILLEWGKPQHGKIERIRDEAIQRFEYLSNYLPFYIHERFSVYAMMADTLRVSDYNLNNSDYDIKRLVIVKDGGYEPEYIDDKGRRLSKVKVLFKRGVQGVIKSICCERVQAQT